MTPKSPRFSIIVPAYNAADYVCQTIESVVCQTETDWELIVIDDGSTDPTAQVVKEFNDHRIAVIRQENRGVSAARNAGFVQSRGEYVLFLDADDILFPDALHRLGKELDERSEAVLSFGTFTRFYSSPPLPAAAREPLRWRPKPSGEALASLLAGSTPLTGSVLARREAIARVGAFDPGLSIGEDWALYCDLATLGPMRYIGGRPVLGYRVHSGSATRKLTLNPKAQWPAIDRVFAREAVRQRFSAKELARLRRRSEAFALGVASREFLRNSDWRHARVILWDAIKRDPASLGDWFFLPFAIVGWLPNAARRFLD